MTEDELQISVAELLDLLAHGWKFMWYHVPGGGHMSVAMGAKRKRMGAKAGCPDIHIDMEGGRTFKIELKTEKGRMSEAQKEWKRNCKQLGIPYYICRSVDEVIEVMEKEFGKRVSR